MGNIRLQWLKSAHRLISEGRGEEVRPLLIRLQKEGVPKRDVLEVAQMARRVGMYHFATHLLIRQLADPRENSDPATLAEYASSIAAQGNHYEGLKIFSSLSPEIQKKYAFEYADILFKNWNYQGAVDFMSRLEFSDLSEYRSLVLYLNYAAALLGVQNFGEGSRVLKELADISKKKNLHLILGNCREMEGQIEFSRGEYSKAENLFLESQRLLKKSGQITHLYADKWLALTHLAQSGPTSAVQEELSSVRNQARTYLSWETLRDLDLFQSHLTGDSQLKSKVYFGTPHEHFRKKALRLWQSKNAPPARIQLGMGKPSGELNLAEGFLKLPQRTLDISENWNSFLSLLTGELYSPLSVYQIFQSIRPEIHFNPVTSKDSVYKTVRSFREWLEQDSLPLKLGVRKNYGYRLRATQPLYLIPTSESKETGSQEKQKMVTTLSHHFGEKEFDRKSCSEILGIADRSVNRHLKALVESGQLIRIGQGPQTRYKIAG